MPRGKQLNGLVTRQKVLRAAAVLRPDLRALARDIIQNTIQQVEAGLDPLPTDQ